MFLRPTWLFIAGCLALGEWSDHRGYLGHEDLFVQFFWVFLPPLLIWSASGRSTPFLSFTVPIFAWNDPLVSLIFLKRSIVFHILLFSSISLHWSLRKAFLSLLASLWNSAFNGYIFPFLLCFSLPFFSQLFIRPPQTATVLFCISFSWGWSWFLSPVQCHKPPSILHQTLCLSDLVPYIYFSLPLYSHKGFDLGHIWMV